MTRNRAHRSLNLQNQPHGAVDAMPADPRGPGIANPKGAIDRASRRLGEARSGVTLVPAAVPDPIFGYPSTEEEPEDIG